MIENAIAVANSKGGVGKSSVAVNLAGLAALNGWHTLLVDLDPQGQVAWELGVGGTELDDQGYKLLNSILTRQPTTALTNVRPGLDIVAAGHFTENTADHLRRTGRGGVEAAIGPIAGDYDLVVFDTPPASGSLLADAALIASHFVVIPTKSDGGSLRGLRDMALRCADLRTENQHLSVLGVVFFAMKASATRRRQDRREALQAGLPEGVVVFDSFIREAAAAGDDLRDMALLAYEYQQQAASAPKWWELRRNGDRTNKTPAYAGNAAELAEDYRNLATEIMAAYTARLGTVV